MNYSDVKKGMTFVEATDPKRPKRTPRKIRVEAARVYSAEVLVLEGRGADNTLSLPLKRLTDPKQWSPCA